MAGQSSPAHVTYTYQCMASQCIRLPVHSSFKESLYVSYHCSPVSLAICYWLLSFRPHQISALQRSRRHTLSLFQQRFLTSHSATCHTMCRAARAAISVSCRESETKRQENPWLIIFVMCPSMLLASPQTNLQREGLPLLRCAAVRSSRLVPTGF